MRTICVAAVAALFLASCDGCVGDDPAAIALPPPFEPVPPALEEAPPPSPRLDEHPALAEVGGLAAGWFLGASQRATHIQLDKPMYRPGESIWVKTWSLTQSGLAGAIASRPLHFQLVGPRGETVERKRVKETGGTATNDFVLPGAANGGLWRVQAIQSDNVLAERSFVVSAYQAPRFRKELEFLQKAYGPGDEVAAAFSISASGGGPLVNQRVLALATVDGVELPPIEATTDAQGELTVAFPLPAEMSAGRGLLTVLVDDGGDTESIARPIPIKLSDLRLAFYPEGGDLVAGLPSRVYFEGQDRFGEPADVAGVVEDDQGNEVAPFESLHDGLGRFTFTPEVGRRYRARLSRPAGLESETFSLPTAKAAGCVLRTFDDPRGDRAPLRAQVRCTDARTVIAVGAQRGEFLGYAAVQAGPEQPGVVHLMPSDPSLARARGLARITVLDEDLQPLAERLQFRNHRRGLKVEVSTDRSSYGPRETVTLTVTTKDQDGKPVPAEVAVSVVDDAVLTLADDDEADLLSAVLLEPDLPGAIEKPAYYFDPDEEDAAAMLELLVGARGWRRFAEPSPGFVVDDKPTKPMKVTEGQPVIEDAPPPPRDDRKARLAEEVSSQSIINLIGSTGEATDGGLLDLLADGDLSSSVSDAFAETGGVAVGKSGVGRGSGWGGDIGGVGTIGNIGGIGGEGIGGYGRAREPEIRARLKQSQAEVLSGEADPALFTRTMRRYSGRFKRCYERVLQSEPSVAGRVVLRVTVNAAGRVTAAQVELDTTAHKPLRDCLESSAKRARFPELDEGPVTFRLPMVFVSEGSSSYSVSRRRPARQRPQFAPVRQFPRPRYDADYVGARTDFRDTVLWVPNLQTGEEGTATTTFPLSDAVATFTARAEGASQSDLGQGQAELRTTLPFSMSVKLPVEVSAGDTLRLPVSLTNTEPEPVTVGLACDLGKLLTEGERQASVDVPAEGKARLFVPVDVADGQASSRIAITADAAGLKDSESRTLNVVPRGFPRASHRSGRLSSSKTHTITLEPELQSIVGSVTFHPDPLSSLEKGMAAMVRQPSGCFEQVSSSNYPNVLILRYLQSRGRARPALVRKARKALEMGYSKLAGYEAPGGGFEWYGRAPAHEELTAYGLLQFADMRAVHRGIDGELLGRASTWLRSRSDGKGGFFKSERAGRFRGVSDALRTAYITNGLVAAKQTPDPQGLAHSASLAKKSSDPYLLALASSTLMASPGKGGAGRSAAARLVGMQQEEGHWSSQQSITSSGDWGRRVETTSLALLALTEAGGHDDAVQRGLSWLHSNRRGARWGSTQATILALRALVAHAEAHPVKPESSTVTVTVNGAAVGTVKYDATTTESLTIPGLQKHLRSGENTIVLQQTGGTPLPYNLSVRSRSRQPANHPEAPLTLTTGLDKAEVPLGEPVAYTATVSNVSDSDAANPLLRLGLPAGLSPQPWQLKKLVEEGEVAAVETRGREVVLYLDVLEAGKAQTVQLDLLAEIPGTTTGPASMAYPYYSDDEKTWAAELPVEVTAGFAGPVMVAPGG